MNALDVQLAHEITAADLAEIDEEIRDLEAGARRARARYHKAGEGIVLGGDDDLRARLDRLYRAVVAAGTTEDRALGQLNEMLLRLGHRPGSVAVAGKSLYRVARDGYTPSRLGDTCPLDDQDPTADPPTLSDREQLAEDRAEYARMTRV